MSPGPDKETGTDNHKETSSGKRKEKEIKFATHNEAINGIDAAESSNVLEMVIDVYEEMQLMAKIEGDIGIINGCLLKNVPFGASCNFSARDFLAKVLAEGHNQIGHESIIENNAKEMIIKRTVLQKEIGRKAKSIFDKKRMIKELVDEDTFKFVSEFLKRMICYEKSEIGKVNTGIVDSAARSFGVNKMIHYGWRTFLKEVDTTKPFRFRKVYTMESVNDFSTQEIQKIATIYDSIKPPAELNQKNSIKPPVELNQQKNSTFAVTSSQPSSISKLAQNQNRPLPKTKQVVASPSSISISKLSKSAQDQDESLYETRQAAQDQGLSRFVMNTGAKRTAETEGAKRTAETERVIHSKYPSQIVPNDGTVRTTQTKVLNHAENGNCLRTNVLKMEPEQTNLLRMKHELSDFDRLKTVSLRPGLFESTALNTTQSDAQSSVRNHAQSGVRNQLQPGAGNEMKVQMKVNDSRPRSMPESGKENESESLGKRRKRKRKRGAFRDVNCNLNDCKKRDDPDNCKKKRDDPNDHNPNER